MKKFILGLTLVMSCVFVFAQDAAPSPVVNWWSSLDFGSLLSIGLGIVATVFASGWALLLKKVRQAGTLLIKFADAVDDKKVDANEKTDLSAAAKELFSKK